jgi:hypothetical protein
VPPLVALLGIVTLGSLMSGSIVMGAAVGAAWGLASAVGIAFGRPWEPGMTQDELDRKYVELKGMTRATFTPDVEEIRRRAGERSMRRYRDVIERKERERRQREDGV